MSKTLTPNSNLDALRKEAKRWLKAIQAGDADARARYAAAVPGAGEAPKLREVQHALARGYGFASWAALKQEIEDRARSHAQRVELFLEKGVHRYGVDPRTGKWGAYERDGGYRGARAAQLLARHPEIAREDIHTAVLAHDIDAVREFLAKDRTLANKRHAFDGWAPLHRLAYARLPAPRVGDALAIATLLLDTGADAAATLTGNHEEGFTVLTGAIGRGEGGQSPHPQAEALARLLIERGADPLDGQALYNTSLGEDDTFWLDLLWTESEKRGDAARWHVEIPNVLGPPLEYLLGNAAPSHPKRVAWLLAHGADATTANFYSKQPVIRHAALAGAKEIVDMLVRHGATAPELGEGERFHAALTRGDEVEARRLAAVHPDYPRHPHAMVAAIGAGRIGIVALLLDLGASPDAADEKNCRPLHVAADNNAVEIAKLLIERGAEIDPVEQRYHSTPLGHANYHGHAEMMALLAPLSRDVRGLCFTGAVERLTELLAQDAGLASQPSRGEAPLFALPEDDAEALAVVEMLLSSGADAAVRNSKGETPAEAARRRGLLEAAEMLETPERD
jgi:ankyrin repeat protein